MTTPYGVAGCLCRNLKVMQGRQVYREWRKDSTCPYHGILPRDRTDTGVYRVVGSYTIDTARIDEAEQQLADGTIRKDPDTGVYRVVTSPGGRWDMDVTEHVTVDYCPTDCTGSCCAEDGPECPPGVHSMFDPCPGGCLNDDPVKAAAERVARISKGLNERLADGIKEAREGRTKDLGDFTQYADDTDTCPGCGHDLVRHGPETGCTECPCWLDDTDCCGDPDACCGCTCPPQEDDQDALPHTCNHPGCISPGSDHHTIIAVDYARGIYTYGCKPAPCDMSVGRDPDTSIVADTDTCGACAHYGTECLDCQHNREVREEDACVWHDPCPWHCPEATDRATYYCPTSGDVESPCHGGFDVCCDRPELHVTTTEEERDDPGILATIWRWIRRRR